MINPVTTVSNTTPASNQPAETNAQSTQPTSASKDETSVNQTPAKSDIRLFIEQDQNTHTYVYRLVDSTTGKVLVEIPREQLSALAAGNPPAGTLIGTTV